MKRRSLLKAAFAAPLAAPALAQPVPTLRFIPQANLTALDPVWTTATVTFNHAYYVFDTLYATDSKGAYRPQMAEGHTVSEDGRIWRFPLRAGLFFHPSARRIAQPPSPAGPSATRSARSWKSRSRAGGRPMTAPWRSS